MLNIIGMLGFAGSGKDTVGGYLVANHSFVKMNFAHPLKDILSVLFSWPRNLLEGDTDESRLWRDEPDEWWENVLDWSNHPAKQYSERFTPRVAMQFVGTDLFRNHFSNDFWINSVKKRLPKIGNVVITDARFPNEVSMLRGFSNTKIWRVEKQKLPEWTDNLSRKNGILMDIPEFQMNNLRTSKIHPSEYEWLNEDFDERLLNYDTKDFLFKQIDRIVNG